MSRHLQVTFDAHDPGALSVFWRDVLGYVIPGPPGVELPEGADPLAAWDEFLARIGVPQDQRNTRSAVEDPDGRGPAIGFLRVPEPKTTKNRFHLDVRVAGGEWDDAAEHERLVRARVADLLDAGATRVREEWYGEGVLGHVVMLDPEGNEFCVA